MTMPVVSDAANELYESISPAWTEGDEDNGWAMLWLCEALAAPALQPLFTYSRDTDEFPGWTSIFDLNRITARQAQYLGQFVGVRVPDGASLDDAKALILDRPASKRERPLALVTAVQALLTGTKRVVLQERDTGSAFHHALFTYSSQTPDPDAVESLIARIKPGPDIIVYNLLTGPSYQDIYDALPTGSKLYESREAMFPTYGDVEDYQP
jgi:hypothetical protein